MTNAIIILLITQVMCDLHVSSVTQTISAEDEEKILRINNIKDQLDDKYDLYKQELNYVVSDFEKNMLYHEKLYKNPLKDDMEETSKLLLLSKLHADDASECLFTKTKVMDALITEGNKMYEDCVDKASSDQLDAEMSTIAHEKIEFDNFIYQNLQNCKTDYSNERCYDELIQLADAEARRIGQYMIDTLRNAQVICCAKPKQFGLCIGQVVRKLLTGKNNIMDKFTQCLGTES